MFISREGRIASVRYSRIKTPLNKESLNLFTYSREAIYQLCRFNKILPTDEVILPNYICSVVVESILSFTKHIRYYDIDSNLKYDEKKIISLINFRTRLILFIDYFGVEASISKNLEHMLNEKDIIVVKDSAHAFLTLLNKGFESQYKYNYLISSIYKNIPIQVGAIAIGKFDKKYEFVSLGPLLRRFFILFVKNILCAAHVKSFMKINKNTLITTNDPYESYSNGINIGGLYKTLLGAINFRNIIDDRQALTLQYYNYFKDMGNCRFKSVFDLHELDKSILQAYPVQFKNQFDRDNMINTLKKECIDAYTWPTFHKGQVNKNVWETVLLIPIDKRVLKIIKTANV